VSTQEDACSQVDNDCAQPDLNMAATVNLQEIPTVRVSSRISNQGDNISKIEKRARRQATSKYASTTTDSIHGTNLSSHNFFLF
jgi:hypothetical protein